MTGISVEKEREKKNKRVYILPFRKDEWKREQER